MGCRSSTFRNNLLYNNHASGISLYDIDGAAGSSNNVVVNNTLVMASNARWALNIGNASTGNTVSNNILYNANSARGSITISSDSLPKFRSDYNVVVNRFSSNGGNTTQTLAQWQSSTGQDRHSFVSTPTALFVNAAGNDYHLPATSPAIDVGMATNAPVKDLDSHPRPSGKGYDIGVYEYQFATTTPPTVTGKTPASGATSVPTNTAVTATAPASATYSLWSNSASPQNPVDPDTNATELGVQFRSDVAGSITGLRFYKGSGNTGTHVGHLWTSSGTLLASVTFTSETASGWQQVNFATPVAITPGTTYVASYYAPVGHYADDTGYFASGYSNSPLHVPANGGVYAYGATSTFPKSVWQASNYWVDVVISTSVTDTTPPTVTGKTPALGAMSVPTNTAVTATFSESVQPVTLACVLNTGPGTPAVPGSVTYTDTTHSATFAPSAPLANSTTYTATVSGAKDLAGNAMSPVTWSFTTAAADTTPPTVTGKTPASGATSVPTNTAVTATFSESVQPATLACVLKDAGGHAMAATMSYTDTTHTVTLTPAALAAASTYTATISGAKDVAGNVMTAPVSWSFTTAAASTTLPHISAVAASGTTSSGATITWTTDVASSSQVEYGTTSSYGNSTTLNPALVTSHSIGLSGLSPNMLYHYHVKSTDAAGNLATSPDYTFTTLANPGQLAIPTTYPRIWWTPQRLQQAKAWWATHSFVPSSSDPWGNAFAYVMTGNAAYGQAAVTLLMNFTISSSELAGTASDNYRWNDWVPVVYDWCHDLMTPAQRSSFMDRYNNYTSIMIGKTWGGPGMPQTDYYWGILRNELNWGIATYGENASAKTFLDDALITRWQNDLLPYFANGNPGGVFVDGSQYGRYDYGYMVIPYTTAGLEGRDLLAETNWYKESALAMIYATSPAPVNSNYIVFPFEDDDLSGGQPAAGDQWYGDYMTMLANEYANIPVGQYARQWLNMVKPATSNFVASTDPGGTARAFNGLPLDYYAAGTQYLYTRNSWNSDATSLFLQFGQGWRHLDAGTFQIYRGDKQLAVEHTGYVTTFADGTDSESTQAHNGILYNGGGEAAAHANGIGQVVRLQSTDTYSYSAVDLTGTYQSTDSQYNNTSAGKTVREFIYVKPLETLFVLDRLESTSASVTKSFLLHTPQGPQVADANHVSMSNGDQMLRVTTLTSSVTPSHNYTVLNEGGGIYRLQDNVSGSVDSFLMHAIQAGPAGGEAVNVSLTGEDANSWTISLSSSKGTATLVLNKIDARSLRFRLRPTKARHGSRGGCRDG